MPSLRIAELVLESAVDYAIITLDLRGLVTSWSVGAERILRWTETEMLGHPADVFFTPEDREAGVPQDEMRNALASGYGRDERWHLRKDGSRFFAQGELLPLRDLGKEPEGFLKILRDRTSQRLNERSTARERERLRQMFEQAPGFFALLKGPNHAFELVNPPYMQLIGHRNVIGLSVRQALPEVVEQGFTDLLDRVFATGEAYTGTSVPIDLQRSPESETERRFLDFVYQPMRDEAGEINGIFVSGSDVTDRVRAESALRELNETLEAKVDERTRERDRLWDNTQDIQVILDSAGVFHAVNAAFTAILGWLPQEVNDRPVFDFVIPDDEEVTDQALQHARTDILATVENRYRHKQGGFRWISWVAAPEGDLIYASGRDITIDKERAAELLEAQEALRQSHKMEAVGQLTGGLAHDFNNLLAGISGSLELMQSRMSQGRFADVERYIVAAQGASRRAAALTHRLLAFSRRQTLDPKPTNVNQLALGMQELIQRTVGPHIPVEVVGAAGLWPALVDASQLENALLNLCINARDAMPEGGRITIETANKWLDERGARQHDMPEGQYLSMCVTDTGTGMTPDVIARAFEPFFTTKPMGEGTGLGLSMIYGFAKQSGGQVRIYSEVGQGTTVCVYLPRFYGEADDDASLIHFEPPSRSEEGETVLIVDDEPVVRMLIDDILQELGYRVLEAGDSATGLKLLQSDARIDLLVTDVGLPGGMNGRQMVDAAKVARPDLKVLFVTGYAENAVLGNGYLSHAMTVLTKPFTMEALAARVRSMIES